MACLAAVVAPYQLAASLFGRQGGLGVGLDRGCGRGTAICCALTKRQLDSSKTSGWQLKRTLLATVVAGGQLSLATVVESGLLNADSQSLHLEAPGRGAS